MILVRHGDSHAGRQVTSRTRLANIAVALCKFCVLPMARRQQHKCCSRLVNAADGCVFERAGGELGGQDPSIPQMVAETAFPKQHVTSTAGLSWHFRNKSSGSM
jgi:hypothetical protein